MRWAWCSGRPLPAGFPIPTFRWRCTWPRCCHAAGTGIAGLAAAGYTAGGWRVRTAPRADDRLDPRLRLPQLAALIAMVSVTIAQVTVGFFAIDRLGLDAAAGARMAGIALTAVGIGLILAQALVMKLEVHPRRWIILAR